MRDFLPWNNMADLTFYVHSQAQTYYFDVPDYYENWDTCDKADYLWTFNISPASFTITETSEPFHIDRDSQMLVFYSSDESYVGTYTFEIVLTTPDTSNNPNSPSETSDVFNVDIQIGDPFDLILAEEIASEADL